MKVLLWVLLLPFFLFAASPEKKITVIVPSYNNSAYCEHNLLSILSQHYRSFRVIYIDDSSTDDTYERVKEITQRAEVPLTLIHNEKNRGALRNIYEAVHMCEDQEIVVLVDGDDFLAHTGVLQILNKTYQDKRVWMTYGNYLDYPSYRQEPLICRPLAGKTIEENSHRRQPWMFSHLRTFYAGLFKRIKKQDLLLDREFFPMGGDLAFMFPMVEMAGVHIRFLEDVLYLYNRNNPLNDHKVNISLQRSCEAIIRARLPYLPLASLE